VNKDLFDVLGKDSLKLLLDVSEFLEVIPPWFDEVPLLADAPSDIRFL